MQMVVTRACGFVLACITCKGAKTRHIIYIEVFTKTNSIDHCDTKQMIAITYYSESCLKGYLYLTAYKGPSHFPISE